MCKKYPKINHDYRLRNFIFSQNERVTISGQIYRKDEERYNCPESILLKNIQIVGGRYAGLQLDHLWIHVSEISNYFDHIIRYGDIITITGIPYRYICTYIKKGIDCVEQKRSLKAITIMKIAQTIISLGAINKKRNAVVSP